MPELKEVIESLGRSFEAFKAENDARLKEIEAKGGADPLLTEKVEKINAELSQISAMKQQVETIDAQVGKMKNWHGGGSSGMDDPAKAEHKKAFNAYIRKGVEAGLHDLEVKAELSTLVDPEGGFAVPEEMSRSILELSQDLSAMRRLADTQTVGTSEYKELVDTGGESAEWTGEKSSRNETATAGLAQVSWFTKELSALPPVTQTMLDDSFFNVEAWVSKFVARAFAKKEGAAWISGNGVEQPKGIAAYTFVANASYAWGKVGYIAGGHASLLNDADKLIDLQHSLKTDYRAGAAWLMNDASLQTIRKFKDGEGNYIWKPGLTEGASDVLFGKRIEYDDYVDSISAGKYPIFYGNFKEAYLIVDRMGIRVLRDPYTKKPYVLFYTTKRTGGGIRNYEALKALKIATS